MITFYIIFSIYLLAVIIHAVVRYRIESRINMRRLKSMLQIAIGNPDNKYKLPYIRASNGKDYLHIWLIDPKKATDSVITLLKELKLINGKTI